MGRYTSSKGPSGKVLADTWGLKPASEARQGQASERKRASKRASEQANKQAKASE